ncbi:short-chain dehydrogenase [Longibacter salinarum]|uniref:Short-chain dehydrogenase n=1 Tax=Longibacter salinarum TaxID=1850348 RepID=A0A2A8CYB9_9BACT|nr:SDR family oxidoreductase [Longibacter salinarum]PEN13646.1 short-chain dehydrogenase [Longibacter salinarum]
MADSSAPVYILIGATGGIGSDVSRRLADDGAQLVLGARSEDELNSLAEETGGDPFPLDATKFEQVQDIVDHAIDTYGRLDGMVNFVGSILLKPAHLTSVDEYREQISKNLDTAFNTVKAGARAMMKEGGSIVLMTSAVARTGLKNHEAIAAAKGGVTGLMRAAAATYASRGVRVNCVAPGLVDTPMSKRILSSEAGRKQSEAMHALGRIGQPEDIGPAVCWLLDPETTWVTGQVIGVDGGLSTVRAS